MDESDRKLKPLPPEPARHQDFGYSSGCVVGDRRVSEQVFA
jgi:hypothetical protein